MHNLMHVRFQILYIYHTEEYVQRKSVKTLGFDKLNSETEHLINFSLYQIRYR